MKTKVLGIVLGLAVLVGAVGAGLRAEALSHVDYSNEVMDIAWRLKERDIEHYQRAAWWGDPKAQLVLGYAHVFGKAIHEDPAKGFELVKRAVDQNLPEAYVGLGNLYAWGKGTSENKGEALKCFRVAAERGNLQGMYTLAIENFVGSNTKRNVKEYLRWINRVLKNCG